MFLDWSADLEATNSSGKKFALPGQFIAGRGSSGQLLSDRYKSVVVDWSGNVCLKRVCDDVDLNPVRGRLLYRHGGTAGEQPKYVNTID